mmetsp:Transcript_5150/g.6297  ORF Transcript_5150/g.6297 Transcript_5150/m.6297 type:complete len:218 (+) Transcript_5150:1097-1750(+)
MGGNHECGGMISIRRWYGLFFGLLLLLLLGSFNLAFCCFGGFGCLCFFRVRRIHFCWFSFGCELQINGYPSRHRHRTSVPKFQSLGDQFPLGDLTIIRCHIFLLFLLLLLGGLLLGRFVVAITIFIVIEFIIGFQLFEQLPCLLLGLLSLPFQTLLHKIHRQKSLLFTLFLTLRIAQQRPCLLHQSCITLILITLAVIPTNGLHLVPNLIPRGQLRR